MATWRWCEMLWLLLALSRVCRAREGLSTSLSGLHSIATSNIATSHIHVSSTTVALAVTSSPTPSPSPSPSSSPSPSPSISLSSFPSPSPSSPPSPPPSTSLSFFPSPSPSQSHSSSSSSSSSSHPPSPSPFLDSTTPYCLYLHIGHMNITYATNTTNITVTGEQLNKLGWSHPTVSNCSRTSSLNDYTHVFGVSETKPQFSITFLFSTNPDSQDQEWYVSEFLHYNYSTNNTVHYRGLKNTIIAPVGMSYMCDNVTSAGSDADDHVAHVSFTDIRAQAFMISSSHSLTYVDCGKTSSNNFVIDLVIGLLVGGTILIAILVIAVTVVVKKFKRREYDLLED